MKQAGEIDRGAGKDPWMMTYGLLTVRLYGSQYCLVLFFSKGIPLFVFVCFPTCLTKMKFGLDMILMMKMVEWY